MWAHPAAKRRAKKCAHSIHIGKIGIAVKEGKRYIDSGRFQTGVWGGLIEKMSNLVNN
jgi:hypothetical protein